MRDVWKNFVNWVEDSVTLSEDSDSIRIRKTTLAIIVFVIIPVNSIWTLSLFYLNLQATAFINLAHGFLATSALIYLFRTRNFTVFYNYFLAFTFPYIYALQTSLGGIIHSGVLISGGLLAAMTAAPILSGRSAIFWSGVNVVGFTLVLGFEKQIAASAPALPPGYSLINGFFNAMWTSFLAMFLILYLVRELEAAQDLADQLLYNVLPRQIAARLKQTPGTIAQAYESASILFADIVGFTPLSNQISPTEMIELLNQIYSHFDMLVEKYGVEKIRTLGDNYMVASGVPTPRPDHAQALSHLALDMLDYCEQLGSTQDEKLQLRIGINSGPLIAGVIGNKKFQYDIWGDAVNTASRMESHGEAGKIQVTQATANLLKDEFILKSRGPIDVKGKGRMKTWFLTGRKEGIIV